MNDSDSALPPFSPGSTLIFDIESHSVKKLFSMPPEEFVRLIGYKWSGDDTVHLTTDIEELKDQISRARWIVGHNIHSFDLPAIYGVKSNEPLELAMKHRVIDTWTHAVLVNPAPYEYINRYGKKRLAAKPDQMKSWFALDEQAFQLGVTGKTHDLKELALEFGSAAFPDAPREVQIDEGFGLIPVTDNRYRDYLVGDVRASEVVGIELLKRGPLNAYALREQEIESRKFIVRANGLKLDIAKATARRDELAARKAVVLAKLQDKYGLPTKGDSPWASNEGKHAIFTALAEYGISPKTVDWPKTDAWAKRDKKIKEAYDKADELETKAARWNKEACSGDLSQRSKDTRLRWFERDMAKAAELRDNPLPRYYGLSLGGEEIVKLTQGTPAEDFGQALAELKGQRTLSQQALDSVHPDGFVHPEITMLQRSGRWSTTEPGLTTWSGQGESSIEKSYFVPDNDDEVLLEIDYSNADSRIVAAYSGDLKYAERFEPGKDGHMINALAAWGEATVAQEPKTYRQKAKVLGHAWNYGSGAKGLHNNTGLPLEDTKTFCDGMRKAFRRLISWQDDVRREANMTGYVVNDWGRRMPVEKGREFTQAPALIGQSGTREIVCDALLRMPIQALRRVRIQVHDALVFSVPKKNVEEWRKYLTNLMTVTFKPKNGGQEIDFPVDSGPAGSNWQLASH